LKPCEFVALAFFECRLALIFPFLRLQRPKLAAHIAMIAAISGEIDAWVALVLGAILDTDATEATMEMYLSLIGTAPRKAAILGAARISLDEERNATLISILKGAKIDARNDLVHGAWAIADDEPDALLLEDHRNRVRILFSGPSWSQFLIDTHGLDPAVAGQMMHEYMAAKKTAIERVLVEPLVYRASDFEDIEKQMVLAMTNLMHFYYRTIHDKQMQARKRLDERAANQAVTPPSATNPQVP
jgi:hypothetical protein